MVAVTEATRRRAVAFDALRRASQVTKGEDQRSRRIHR
jgi:hypothetical protein